MRYILYGIALFAVLPLYVSGQPEAVDSLAREIANASNPLEQQEQFIQFMLKEQEKHRSFLERMIDRSFRISGIILAVFLGIVAFFGLRSWKGMKTFLKEQVTYKWEREADKLLSEKLIEFEGGKLEPIKQQIKAAHAYQNSRILFVGAEEQLMELKRFVIDLLNYSGIQNTMMAKQANHLNLADIDIIVHCYSQNGNGAGDPALVDLLMRIRDRTIPIVIYTNDRQQTDEERKLLDQHKWYVFANMPLTLLTQLYNTANIFYTAQHHEPSRSHL